MLPEISDDGGTYKGLVHHDNGVGVCLPFEHSFVMLENLHCLLFHFGIMAIDERVAVGVAKFMDDDWEHSRGIETDMPILITGASDDGCKHMPPVLGLRT